MIHHVLNCEQSVDESSLIYSDIYQIGYDGAYESFEITDGDDI